MCVGGLGDRRRAVLRRTVRLRCLLRGLKNLRSFTGYDIYGFSAEDFLVRAQSVPR